MAVWEYKVITSGKGGFATPALLESFLNDLGKDEWEIIRFHTPPDNPLAFTGLARRSTQRDWTLEDAVATAARAEADKLRAEFEAKFKGGAASADEKAEAIGAEKAGADDGFRKLRDTESDLDPDAPEESETDEWDKLANEDELPTFFEAIRPLMRRNQRGAGLSAGVDHLAKKWGMSEEDVIGALKECGLTIPEDEDDRPAYVEYDGDLYWVNVNRRGELWINVKEKPRPVFRIVAAAKVAGDEAVEAPANPPRPAPAADAPAKSETGSEPVPAERRPAKSERTNLPEGPALLEKILPLMRHNREGSGGSGSVGFLSRALKCRETDLADAFIAIGLGLSSVPGEAPPEVEIGTRVWWLNRDQRGGVWINMKEKSALTAEASAVAPPAPAEAGAGEASPALSPDAAASAAAGAALPALRLLLKETRTGALAGEVGRLAETIGKTPEDLLAALTGAGLKVPEKPREKPLFVEHAAEIFWLNRNAKGQLWLNAKASKYAASPDEGEFEKKSRGRRTKAAGES